MMNEAAVFKFPYNMFLMERLEFVLLTGDDLEAKIMRIIEYEMIRQKERWQDQVAQAIESKKAPPREPKDYWVRLSHTQIIAKLYKFDTAKVGGAKRPLSMSKTSLRRAINNLVEKKLIFMQSMEGDEYGAPLYTLNRPDIQAALDAFPSDLDPFSIFYLMPFTVEAGEFPNCEGGVSKLESGEFPNWKVGSFQIAKGEFPNWKVFKEYKEGDKNQQESKNVDRVVTPPQEAADAATLHALPDDLTAEEIALVTKIIQERRQQTSEIVTSDNPTPSVVTSPSDEETVPVSLPPDRQSSEEKEGQGKIVQLTPQPSQSEPVVPVQGEKPRRTRRKPTTPPPQPEIKADPPAIVLEERPRAVFAEWCKMPWFRGVAPDLTETVAKHCITLSAYDPLPTCEDMLKTRRWYETKYPDRKGKGWYLGNFVNAYPQYLSDQYQSDQTANATGQSDASSEQPVPVRKLTKLEERNRELRAKFGIQPTTQIPATVAAR